MAHARDCLPGVSHLAVLNLYREPDGTLELTIAMADGAMIEFRSKVRDTNPIDYVEMLIINAADRMAARRKPFAKLGDRI